MGQQQEVKEGILRLLTLGEVKLATQVFGNSISYNRVWVHCDSYLPFGLQDKDVGMTPNGEMYFRKEEYSANFAAGNHRDQHFFIHEMSHVWQYQKGCG